jgi:hypothetical protein
VTGAGAALLVLLVATLLAVYKLSRFMARTRGGTRTA